MKPVASRWKTTGLIYVGLPDLALAQTTVAPPTSHFSLLLDWSFWAAVLAAVALVLSQIPPILTLIRRAKVEIELYARLYVSHTIGNPNVQLHVILRNVGGRSIRIGGMKLRVKRDKSDLVVLPAQSYLQDPSELKKQVLFTRVQLDSNAEWANFVNFFNYFSRVDENAFKAAEVALRENITAKKALPGNADRLIDSDPALAIPFQTMFTNKFVWTPGEYEVELSVEDSDGKIVKEKKFSFTLFETDSNDMAKAKEVFKTGDGVNWHSGKHQGVGVPIREIGA